MAGRTARGPDALTVHFSHHRGRCHIQARGDSFAAAVGRALRRAGTSARKTARLHGTRVYVWKDGKIVAEKP